MTIQSSKFTLETSVLPIGPIPTHKALKRLPFVSPNCAHTPSVPVNDRLVSNVKRRRTLVKVGWALIEARRVERRAYWKECEKCMVEL